MSASDIWVIVPEFGKLNGKPVPVFYVGPKGSPYGYATFLDRKGADVYLKSITEDDRCSGAQCARSTT